MKYATERAKMLFGCYRRTDAADPDVYVAAVAIVLSLYDPDLIREVTDPRTGIQTSEKFAAFMPNAGELKVYCEVIATRRERLEKWQTRAQPAPRLPAPPPRAGDLANVFVSSKHPKYDRVCHWAKTADPLLWRYDTGGIWAGYNALDGLGCISGGTGMAQLARELADKMRAQREQRAAEQRAAEDAA